MVVGKTLFKKEGPLPKIYVVAVKWKILYLIKGRKREREREALTMASLSLCSAHLSSTPSRSSLPTSSLLSPPLSLFQSPIIRRNSSIFFTVTPRQIPQPFPTCTSLVTSIQLYNSISWPNYINVFFFWDFIGKVLCKGAIEGDDFGCSSFRQRHSMWAHRSKGKACY